MGDHLTPRGGAVWAAAPNRPIPPCTCYDTEALLPPARCAPLNRPPPHTHICRCGDTLESLFTAAAHPHRVFVGAVAYVMAGNISGAGERCEAPGPLLEPHQRNIRCVNGRRTVTGAVRAATSACGALGLLLCPTTATALPRSHGATHARTHT